MKTTWLVVGVLLFISAVEAGAQSAGEIPVYPGAELVIEAQGGEESGCCSFRTHDPYQKVLSFYEGRLKQKAMDSKSLAAKYPAMKPQFQQMEKQMPPNIQIRFFVIKEMEFMGKKGAELFELLSSPIGVTFHMTKEELGISGAKFAREWGEKTGKLTPEELVERQRVEAENQAAQEEAVQEKQSAEDVKRDKKRGEAEQAERGKRVLAALEKELPRNDIRLYPAARQGVFLEACGEVGDCTREFRYASSDDFQKVHDFYAAQLQADIPLFNEKGELATQASKNGEKESLLGFGDVYAWRFAHLGSKKCRAAVGIQELSEKKNGPKKVYISYEFTNLEIPKGCAGFNETMKEIEK